jgi:hypothetical protein
MIFLATIQILSGEDQAKMALPIPAVVAGEIPSPELVPASC